MIAPPICIIPLKNIIPIFMKYEFPLNTSYYKKRVLGVKDLIYLETEIEGKQMTFGEAKQQLKEFGLFMGGNWEYDRGMFDGIMHREREEGETIYIRLPFEVIHGELDREDAYIRFQKPFIIKHVVNVGLDYDSNSLLTASGLAQFQKPKDKDGYIHDKSKWEEFGEELVGDILDRLK